MHVMQESEFARVREWGFNVFGEWGLVYEKSTRANLLMTSLYLGFTVPVNIYIQWLANYINTY